MDPSGFALPNVISTPKWVGRMRTLVVQFEIELYRKMKHGASTYGTTLFHKNENNVVVFKGTCTQKKLLHSLDYHDFLNVYKINIQGLLDMMYNHVLLILFSNYNNICHLNIS